MGTLDTFAVIYEGVPVKGMTIQAFFDGVVNVEYELYMDGVNYTRQQLAESDFVSFVPEFLNDRVPLEDE